MKIRYRWADIATAVMVSAFFATIGIIFVSAL